jgi:hypothetical protein
VASQASKRPPAQTKKSRAGKPAAFKGRADPQDLESGGLSHNHAASSTTTFTEQQKITLLNLQRLRKKAQDQEKTQTLEGNVLSFFDACPASPLTYTVSGSEAQCQDVSK